MLGASKGSFGSSLTLRGLGNVLFGGSECFIKLMTVRPPVERGESKAERNLMGPRYDSVLLGKETAKKSEWLLERLRQFES